MIFYETDKNQLRKFLLQEKIDGEFKEEYLILYNFAEDCMYAQYIQPDLINSLLPFYLKTIEQAILRKDKTALDIYGEFNSAKFFNQKIFKNAVGVKNYDYIMEYYRTHTIKKMEMQNKYILEWVSLFNTTVAFGNNNIQKLFHQIFEGSNKVKYSFFQYLSNLLFKENDNLCAVNERKDFWTSDIWDFDDGCISEKFFWSDDIIEFFDKEINKERITALFEEIKPFVCDILHKEIVGLLYEEMKQSFDLGVFYSRKAEFLKKINCKSERILYWDSTF